MGTITLNTPGTYQYDCSIGSHAANGMVGTIIVEAAASTVDVTFNVNMANETTSPDGVFLAGGADFGVAGDNLMSDDDGDDIWTITNLARRIHRQLHGPQWQLPGLELQGEHRRSVLRTVPTPTAC